MSDEWLSLREAAQILGVHPSTVRNWADQGHLAVHRTQGGHRRFRQEDVLLWQKAHRGTVLVDSMVQDALRRTRIEISDGKLVGEGWYQKLDAEARDQYRQSGRSLMLGLISYLSTAEVVNDAEARSLGYEYASRGHRCGLSSVEAVNAFLFFRNLLVDSLLNYFETAGVRSPHTWSDMMRKVQAFTDLIMVTLLETYEAYHQRGGR